MTSESFPTKNPIRVKDEHTTKLDFLAEECSRQVEHRIFVAFPKKRRTGAKRKRKSSISTCAHLVCKKVLSKSDTDKNLNRLVLHMSCFIDNLLPSLNEREREYLENGIPVKGFDQAGRVWNLKLTYWPCNKLAVVNKEWTKLVKKNGLKARKDTVHVWFYRSYGEDGDKLGQLYFMIGTKGM